MLAGFVSAGGVLYGTEYHSALMLLAASTTRVDEEYGQTMWFEGPPSTTMVNLIVDR